MFDSIARSFRLVKVCFHVLMVDKELVVFPLLSTIALLIVGASFLGIGMGVGALERIGTEGAGVEPVDAAVAFGFYFTAYVVVIFFNSALVYAANYRLAGGDPNVLTGIDGAVKHLPAILAWALVSGTVGLVLQALSNRQRNGVAGMIAQIVIAMLGAAWTMVTYFVVPLIVIEGRGFTDSFKGSLSLFRRTWGEQVMGNFGLGIASMLTFLAAALVLALLFFVLSVAGTFGIVLWAVLAVVTVVTIALVFATLDGIYKAALYQYASTGNVPDLFPPEVVREGWKRDTRGGSTQGPGANWR